MRVGAVVLALLAVVVPTGAAWADDPLAWTSCSPGSTDPWCDVGVSVKTAPSPSARPAARAASGGTRACHDIAGQQVPCYDPIAGSLGTDGCYYKPASPSPELQAALGGAGTGPGGWYDVVCPGVPGTGGGTVWIAGGPPAAGQPSAAAVAQVAVSRLQLPRPGAGMSPAGDQVVRVPTWLWIDPDTWGPHSATAELGGVSVTATARPTRAVWSMGDGSTVRCAGAGTPWRAGGDPSAASPTCGHTYVRGSSVTGGGTFPVTATVTWSVSWVGAGQSGTAGDLSTTTAFQIRVSEVSAVVTR
jgi:hypothetical protein